MYTAVAEQLTIPGDQRLAERIRQAAGRNTLGHAVILSGQGDLTPAADFLAAAMECQERTNPAEPVPPAARSCGRSTLM